VAVNRSRKLPVPFPAAAPLLQRMFTRLGCAGRPPQFVAEFYPYASLVQTIRLRGDVACVRFSDLLRRAPLPVLESAAAILLSKLYRRRLPRELALAYNRYSLEHGTRRRVERIRRRRARRAVNGPQGQAFDLAPMFDALNARYFAGALPRPQIGWSARPWRRQLGLYDPGLRQIVLSAALDRPRVPRYAVEYVLFHEMLHVKHPLRLARCGLQAHSPEFRAEEKRYAHYQAARRYLNRTN
jgi:hypothetical protein